MRDKRRKKLHELVITRAASVLPETDQRLLRFAQEREWTPAKTAGWLIERGLDAVKAERQERAHAA